MATVGGKFTFRKRNLVTYVEDQQYELLRELADRQGSSVSAVAAEAIRLYLSQHKAELAQRMSRN